MTMNALTERLKSLSPEQRALLELHLKEKKLKIPALEIPRVPRGGDLPLSFAQQRLWLLQQLSPESPLYNTYLPIRLEGPLQIGALEQSVHEIVRRHEVLHTTFAIENGCPVQRPDPALRAEFRIVDLKREPESEKPELANRLLLEELKTPFNLQSRMPLRMLLVSLTTQDHILLVILHHVVSDRWSVDVLASELSRCYEAHTQNRPSPLSELSIQYADFAVWQRERMKGEALRQHLSYWKQKLQGLAPLNLPVDERYPDLRSWDGSRAYLKLEPRLVENLEKTGQRLGATLFMTILALFKVLLFRYTGADDLAVGTPVSNRSNPRTRDLIGCFVNTLILRSSLSGNPDFSELLQRVKQTCLDAYTWQDLPFERLVEEFQPQRSADHSPMFRTIFTLNDVHEPLHGKQMLEATLLSSGLRLSRFELDNCAVATDLILRVERLKDETICALEYRTQLFRHETIVRMLGHLRILLDAATTESSGRIADVPLLTEAERRTILTDWNNSGTEWRDRRPIVDRIAEHARKMPLAPAVAGFETVLSHGELNRKANRWARVLREYGVRRETIVGVWLDRSPEMVIALLAIWKAGGAYLPVGEVPPSRAWWMLTNAGSGLLITHPDRSQPGVEWAGTVLTLQMLESAGAGHAETNPELTVNEEDLAYVIYTSGSTGRPKGVMIQHGGLLNLIEWHVREYRVDAHDRAGSLASLGFDAAVWELWPYLICGATLHLADDETRLSPERLLQWLWEREITISFVPTPLAHALLRLPWPEQGRLRFLLTGGDRLHPVDTLSAHFRLVNHYGPTESTVVATSAIVDPETEEVPSIGRPIPNSTAYVLNEEMQPVPVGVNGELYVGGAGLARGYLGRPELTAERFVPHPYSEVEGARLYRTGDWARYRENGELEFAGRQDGQVKIRGFRVEAGEIEAALIQHPGVKAAAVLVRGGNKEEGGTEGEKAGAGEKRIVACIVAKEEGGVSGGGLREYLLEKLPEYMVPRGWVMATELPLTANGKVDREALGRYKEESSAGEEEYAAPRTAMEQTIADLWQEILGAERIGIHANFFALGGHSLLASQMISRLSELLSVELPLRSVFENATVARLARALPETAQPGGRRLPPITASTTRARAPLSHSQHRLWIVASLEPQSAAYNIPFAISLKGRLNVAALWAGLHEILRRHEVLRAVFTECDGEPVQEIREDNAAFSTADISSAETSEKQKALRQLMQAEADKSFDLQRGPLFRATLVRLDHDTDHVLLVTMHHIVSDGWSVGILLKEFGVLYRAHCEGTASPLPALRIQYADFAQWQREWLQGDVLEEHLKYWREKLANLPAPEFPLDHPRPPISGYRAGHVAFTVPSATAEKLRELAQREGASPFMLVVAAFQLLLSRYCRQPDVVVGCDIACRDRVEIENLAGFFVNQLVLRAEVKPAESFRQLLRQVRETTLEACAYQDLPFEKLVDALAPPRALNRHPLFQYKVAMQYALNQRVGLPHLQLRVLENVSEYIKTDIRLVANESPAFSAGRVEYAVDLLSHEKIQRFTEHWLVLLDNIAATPDQPVSELSLLTMAEYNRLLREKNVTRDNFNIELVCDQFERQAKAAPGAIAVVFEDRQVTYTDLNTQANQLAHYLRQCGTGPESLTVICMERSFEMILSVLAVLKAGGAYVPLDPTLPDRRLSMMLDQTRAPLVLTRGHLLTRLESKERRVICVDTDWEEIATFPGTTLHSDTLPENLAYLLYTSGSTGTPKGVMIDHASLANYVAAVIRRTELNSEFTYAMAQPLTADSSVTVLFSSLCLGGTLHVVSEDVAMDGRATAEYFDRHGIDCLKIAPTHLAALRASWSSGPLMPRRRLIIGGEASNYDWIAGLAKANPQCLIFNHYGPTETTVGVLTYRVTGESNPEIKTTPLEKPLANTEAYVLDESFQPLPAGIPGELYIGGRNVARGYRDQPSLTAERFLPDSFGGIPGARLYRTGDLVRVDEKGLFDYLGRTDDQVKIRGFRVELREVEVALLSHPNVQEAAVISCDDAAGNKQLAAYVVARHQPSPSPAALREFAGHHLPHHMIPAAFATLEQMPRLPHGKLERKALPAPVFRSGTEAGYEPTGSYVEEVVAAVWKKLLARQRIGRFDNFFDLGGNSLLAIQVISQIRQVFLVEMPFRTLFAAPTLGDFSRAVEERRREAQGLQKPAIVPALRAQAVPLSFAQRRLWFLHSLDPANTTYVIPVVVRLQGQLDIGALQESFDALASRHEILRTTFPVENHEPVQVIAAAGGLPVVVRDLRVLASEDREGEVRKSVARAAGEPFDLAGGPLLRVQLLRISDDGHVLILVLHHIISDAWSGGILVEELAAFYEAFLSSPDFRLPPLPIQYADFAIWQRSRLHGEEPRGLLTYWTRRLANSPPLMLPRDYPDDKEQSETPGAYSANLGNALSQELKELARRQGATDFMVILAAFATLLVRYTGGQEVNIGSPVAGRTHAELELLLGCFVNTLVFRVSVHGNPDFSEVVRRVRELSIEAYEHQDLPFERLVEELHPARETSHTPIVDVMFVLQNVPHKTIRPTGLEMSQMQIEPLPGKFNLMLSLRETQAGFQAKLEYNPDRFAAATMERFFRHFERLLREVTHSPDRPVRCIPLLDAVEQRQLLIDWNRTAAPYPAEQPIHRLLEKQAAARPDAVAIEFRDRSTTYRELNEKSNQLARCLLSMGITPEQRVAICLKRSPDLIISLLAILKAGAAYAPLDAGYPKERLRFMLEDTGAAVLITEYAMLERLPEAQGKVICLETDWPDISGCGRENLPSGPQAENLACVMYTSGSTGTPRGVAVTHRNIVRLVQGNALAAMSQDEVFFQFAPVSFDASTFEIWGALLNGAKLVICPHEDPSLSDIGKAIQEYEVTTLWLTAGLFSLMIDEQLSSLSQLRQLLAGGDVLSVAHVRQAAAKLSGRLINGYGPTENTTFSCCHTIAPQDHAQGPVSIGRPITNSEAYVLDEEMQLVPVRAMGELYVGGAGLARGYLGRPELTAERFVPHPYSEVEGARLYRTGDWARYRENGELEFAGRQDGQVKIRGFRVEAGEIEAALMQHPGVKAAVVLVREGNKEGGGTEGEKAGAGEKRIIGCIVAKEEGGVSGGELRDYLLEKLPEYMVPRGWVMATELPLTANGKVDREALGRYKEESSAGEEEYAAPRTAMEQTIADLWQEILGAERIGIHANFFALGGHSLLAIRMISRLQEVFHINIPLQVVFDSPTIAEMAEGIEVLLWMIEAGETPSSIAVKTETEDTGLPG